MNYNYLIIDADATTKLQLQLYLQEYEDFVFLDVAKNPTDGLNAILKYTPDVVFINLGEDSSVYFQMVTELNQFVHALPIMIAFSKSKKYAYNAIKSGFFDYWVLPHNEFDVRKTILRLRKRYPVRHYPSTICLKSYNDYRYLNTSEILYLKSDNNATDFFMRNGSRISAFRTLKSFEQFLPPTFMRVHQSYIINSTYVSRINYGKCKCTLRTETEDELPFSKTYKEKIDAIKERLSKSATKTFN